MATVQKISTVFANYFKGMIINYMKFNWMARLEFELRLKRLDHWPHRLPEKQFQPSLSNAMIIKAGWFFFLALVSSPSTNVQFLAGILHCYYLTVEKLGLSFEHY